MQLPVIDPTADAFPLASPPSSTEKRGTFSVISLGCPKNLVDSERMLGLLREDGLELVSDHGEADAVVVNTCGFLEASRLESLEVIREALGQVDELLEGVPRGRGPEPAELVAHHLRGALDALATIGGRIEPDEVLGRIYASFCIGK